MGGYIMKKMKKLVAGTLVALLISVGLNIMNVHGPSDDPNPIGNSNIIHLG